VGADAAYQATVLALRLRSLEEADHHVGAPGLALAGKEARRMALAATTPVTVGAAILGERARSRSGALIRRA
jgi:hypothetical protein